MLKVCIKTIPHKAQRYPTVGDWTVSTGGRITIFVSEMGNWKYEALVALHELVEVLLCKDRGISQGQVDNFDSIYEENRKNGDLSEPGDSIKAPYRKEHFFATNIERLMSRELGIEWSLYDETVVNL